VFVHRKWFDSIVQLTVYRGLSYARKPATRERNQRNKYKLKSQYHETAGLITMITPSVVMFRKCCECGKFHYLGLIA